MAYYRAYSTKPEAKEATKRIREPDNTPRGFHYPISVTIQPVKNADSEWLWAVYYYQR